MVAQHVLTKFLSKWWSTTVQKLVMDKDKGDKKGCSSSVKRRTAMVAEIDNNGRIVERDNTTVTLRNTIHSGNETCLYVE